MMNYLVMIADIIDSRSLADRRSAQKQLEAVLDTLNHKRDDLLSPYTITLGDEFQAVFCRGERVFSDMLEIMASLHPIQVRFSLGLGPITTDINQQTALGMDGPAFYDARDALEAMKKRPERIAISGTMDSDKLITGAIGLLSHTLQGWKPNRFAILKRLMDDEKVSEIAEHLDISQQAVYQNIRQGGLEAVGDVITGLAEKMNQSLTT